MRFGFLLVFCLWLQMATASTVVTLYAYHQAPPFVINADTETGLNYDLLRALQQELGDQVQLQLRLLSRPELNQRLAAQLPVIALWTNPAWFAAQEPPYLWSATLFSDREVFVSPQQHSQKIQQLSDLTGSRIGAIRGYSYPGLNELFAEGKAQRIDADSDKENLALLLEKQLEHVVITRSSFLYYGRQTLYLGKLKITGQPYPAYRRQILFTRHYQDLYPQFEQALQQLSQQKYWLDRLALYGLKPL